MRYMGFSRKEVIPKVQQALDGAGLLRLERQIDPRHGLRLRDAR